MVLLLYSTCIGLLNPIIIVLFLLFYSPVKIIQGLMTNLGYIYIYIYIYINNYQVIIIERMMERPIMLDNSTNFILFLNLKIFSLD